jgi:hypothetical protein
MEGLRTHKLATGVTAALAAALAAVPVAQARLAVDAQYAALLNRQPVVRTDARHAALLSDAPVRVQVVQPHTQGNNGPAKLNLSTGKTSTTTVSTGFGWSEAGIGAGSAVGLFLLAGAGVLVTRRSLAPDPFMPRSPQRRL